MKLLHSKWWKRLAYGLCSLALICGLILLSINAYVKHSVKAHIVAPELASQLENVDCILVLGCSVRGSTPSPMLKDRLDQGVQLYQNNASQKLLMSGDHGQTDYDEVNAMKQYAIDSGIPSEDIFMDHAGFSTYESMYRARDVFCAKKVIIVTQDYHLYRALYVAKTLGLDAYGVAAKSPPYSGQVYRDLRELLARNKDFLYVLLRPAPSFLGEAIPVSGNGNITNDE